MIFEFDPTLGPDLDLSKNLRKFVSVSVILSLLYPPVAFSQNNDDSRRVDNQNTEIQNSNNQIRELQPTDPNTLDIQKDIQKDIAKNVESLTAQHEQLLPLLFDTAAKFEKYTQDLEVSHGENYVNDLIEKNQLKYEDEEQGIRMEYRLIDKNRVPRLLINDHLYFIIDEKIIQRDSKHLEQIVARSHFESGPGRPVIDEKGVVRKDFFGFNKTQTGRDLSLVFINDGQLEVDTRVKPKATSWKWWSEYFHSKKKMPTEEDVSLAIFTSVLQGGLTAVVLWIKQSLGHGEFTMEPVYWSMAYAFGVGTIISFYRNWTTFSGSRFTRVLKSLVFSLVYAFGLVLTVPDHGNSLSDRLESVNPLDKEGFSKDSSVLVNGLSNNYAKDYWNQIPRFRESNRENVGKLHLKVPFKKNPIVWSQSKFESQILYLIPWSINVISLISLASTDIFKISGTQITLPVFQFLGIPFAMMWAKWYARSRADKAKQDPNLAVQAKDMEETAQKYEKMWNNSFGMDVNEIPGKILSGSKAAKERLKLIGRNCLDLLK